MRVVCAALLALVGCGRVGFDGRTDAQLDSIAPDAMTLGFNFASFSGCPDTLSLVGVARCDPAGYIELTPATGNVEGTIWFAMPFAITPDMTFTSEMRLQFIVGTTGGDGIAWAMQADADGANAIGGPGDGFGIAELAPSLRVELDTYQNPWDLDGNHAAIQYDQVYMTPLDDAPVAFDMTNGDPFTLVVEYDGARDTLDAYVYVTTRPLTPTVSWVSNLDRFGSQLWFGIGAATGTVTSSHRLLAWRMTVTP